MRRSERAQPARKRRVVPSVGLALATLWSGLACSPASTPGESAASIDFQNEVRPILAEHCFGCHGADSARRAAGLRLDVADGVFDPRPGGGAPVVIKGDAAESLLVQRVSREDARRMPPPAAGPGLSAEEIAVLERWIDAGAPYPPHWSLAVPERPRVPAAQSDWVRNPIDAFVLERLSATGLQPAPSASPSALLRRVTLGLTGLAPTPEDLAAFASDPSQAAYERYVDRLLDTPAFGEQRARYWLDVARYADTHGFHKDAYRSIWPYRDYVIEAFTSNKPFDEFTVEQLAGDLLASNASARVATGFIRAGMSTAEGGIVEDEYAAIYAKDRVDTMAAAWLGMTVGCADCHDHKFDAITQAEFYSLTAYFRNTTQPILDEDRADAPPTIRVAPSLEPTLVTDEKPGEPFAYVLERGDYNKPGARVTAGVPASLPPLPGGVQNNRLGLARWLVDPEHPLTARVVANRFWSELFGQGLVTTPTDFGQAGDPPSHPELLDWLAVELRDSGWDVKHLFRLMVTSATYVQSARLDADQQQLDPNNRLLSRGPHFRMDGEMIRDVALQASGLLVGDVGGPSVKPYQPDGLWEAVSSDNINTSVYVQDSGQSLYRRSMYTFWKRQAPPPALEIFNAPTREHAVAQRERTNTPLQALVTMNDVQLVEAARVLATRALEAGSASRDRLDFMSLRVLSRVLSDAELTLLLAELEELEAAYRAAPAAADELVHSGDSEPAADLDVVELAAWTLVASTLLNLDEALTQ